MGLKRHYGHVQPFAVDGAIWHPTGLGHRFWDPLNPLQLCVLPKVQPVILFAVAVREREEERDRFRKRQGTRKRESVSERERETTQVRDERLESLPEEVPEVTPENRVVSYGKSLRRETRGKEAPSLSSSDWATLASQSL